MSTEKKLTIGAAILTVVIITGGVFVLTAQDTAEKTKESKPLMGQKVADEGRNHLPDGTKITYQSNPPASGPHYVDPQPAGFYDKEVPDGNLVHSLEHGAVIVWYKPDLPKADIATIKTAFDSAAASKKLMVPRKSLDVPVALTSWDYLLKLKTIDQAKIKEFIETNNDRAPEKAPL